MTTEFTSGTTIHHKNKSKSSFHSDHGSPRPFPENMCRMKYPKVSGPWKSSTPAKCNATVRKANFTCRRKRKLFLFKKVARPPCGNLHGLKALISYALYYA
ncbi:hypothetical protein CDAR_535691 [Caerostris darwini]|uniref:Uncharacterized protein n=1 Tax=Caerostris darwini TaxID=1538125 RepID=A0AAV4QUL3_9ARAC|nr:hypothetical protein CDAR_535691 [Caerostris darwini]